MGSCGFAGCADIPTHRTLPWVWFQPRSTEALPLLSVHSEQPNLTSFRLGFSPIGRCPHRSWSQTLSLSNLLAPLPLLHGISSLKLYLGFPRFCLFCSFSFLLNLSDPKRFMGTAKSLVIPLVQIQIIKWLACKFPTLPWLFPTSLQKG